MISTAVQILNIYVKIVIIQLNVLVTVKSAWNKYTILKNIQMVNMIMIVKIYEYDGDMQDYSSTFDEEARSRAAEYFRKAEAQNQLYCESILFE